MPRYRFDPKNLRQHPDANRALIRRSLEEVGAGRSILIDGEGIVRAGNQTLQEAEALGYEVVEVAGGPRTLIAVRRDDLTGDAAIRAGFYDNASSDSSAWSPEELLSLVQTRPDVLAGALPDADMAALLASVEAQIAPPAPVAPGNVEDIEPNEAGDIPDLVAPFPWFGGKARVASRIWARLGAVANYVEPFCGSAAVLLAAPSPPKIATLNDADGYVANFWRALIAAPDEVARHLDWPVNEIDLFSRHVWLIKRSGELRQRLEAEPEWYDTKVAGWWCWGACAWIGTGWCSGEGPWNVGEGGALINVRDGNAGQGVNRQLPHLGNAGQGVCDLINDHLHGYMFRLADALRTARVTCGDWARVVTDSVTTRHGLTGVVLDPPYGEGAMEYSGGGNADTGIAADVWRWAVENGDDPQLRIAVCGYEDGRAVPPGWSAMRWTARKGYQATEEAIDNPTREIIYFSPHCITPERV